jgi:hypothetical protein
MNEQINNGAVRVLRDYTGRGPTKARTVIEHNSVTILLTDGGGCLYVRQPFGDSPPTDGLLKLVGRPLGRRP